MIQNSDILIEALVSERNFVISQISKSQIQGKNRLIDKIRKDFIRFKETLNINHKEGVRGIYE